MAWLAKLGAGVWAKLALLAGIVAAGALFVMRLIKAGADAEKAKSAKAAHDHQTSTADKVSKSDEALADPKSPHGQRVRDRFSRD
jgi:hypothetical protein